jgi:hypothetical protein
MVKICLIPFSVVLFLIVISLFHHQIMKPHVTYDVGNEYAGLSYNHLNAVKDKEGFWYDMNRLEDASWYSGKLDDEFKSMINNENNWRNNLIKSNIKRRGWKHTPETGQEGLSLSEQKSVDRLSQRESSAVPLTEEGFGNHRAPEDWNEVDYPIVTSNGINMTPSFPQNGILLNSMYKHPNVRKLWGEFDMLKPDDPIVRAMAAEQKMTSRTIVSHSIKN